MNRQLVFSHGLKLLDDKIALLQSDSMDLQRGMAEDSKSSAGDKFETAREMAQQELSKLQIQIAEQHRLKNLLEKNLSLSSETAQVGSVVQTNVGNFILGIPIGKIEIKQQTFVGIGVTAPMGQLLLNKRVGEHFQFNQQTIQIEELY